MIEREIRALNLRAPGLISNRAVEFALHVRISRLEIPEKKKPIYYRL